MFPQAKEKEREMQIARRKNKDPTKNDKRKARWNLVSGEQHDK